MQMSQVCRLPANEIPSGTHNFELKAQNHSFIIALFCVCKHIRHKSIGLQTNFLIQYKHLGFCFCQSSLEAMSTSLEAADITSKNHYNQHLGPI